MKIVDMASSPNFNPATNKDREEWSLYDVSNKEVDVDPNTNTPRCIDHNAMNCVSPDRTIWRCLTCSRSCYDMDRYNPNS